MLQKHFSIIMTITIVFFMSLIAFGRNDLGVGVDIDNETLNFTVYSSGLRLVADFSTSYARTESLSDPTEGEVDLKLPVWGQKILSINLKDTRKALSRFIVTVKLQTVELQSPPEPDKKSYDTQIVSQKTVVDGALYNGLSRWEIQFEEPIKISCYGEITKLTWSVVTNPSHTPSRDTYDIPIEFIPIVDEDGRLLPCCEKKSVKVPVAKVKVITDSCEDTPKEPFDCRVTTWTKIILGQEEKDPPPRPIPSPESLLCNEPPLCKKEPGVSLPSCYYSVEEVVEPDPIAEVAIRTVRCGPTTWTKIISETKGK